MLIACATFVEVAAMARRSSLDAPGIVSATHAIPFVVRVTVPRTPLAHATSGDTTLNPRNSPLVPLDWGIHCAVAAPGVSRRAINETRNSGKRGIERICGGRRRK